MSKTKIPNGHQTVMPYLIIDEAVKFKNFATSIFNAEIAVMHYRDDEPAEIGHAEMRIGDNTIMFCDSRAEWPARPANLFIYVDNADDTYKKAIEQGGTGIMEPMKQVYGRSCGVADPCGNIWWITSV